MRKGVWAKLSVGVACRFGREIITNRYCCYSYSVEEKKEMEYLSTDVGFSYLVLDDVSQSLM